MWEAGYEKDYIDGMYDWYGDIYLFIFRVRGGHFEVFSGQWCCQALRNFQGFYDESTGENVFPGFDIPGTNITTYFPYFAKTTPRLTEAYGHVYLLADLADYKRDPGLPPHLFEVLADGTLKDVCKLNTNALYGRFGMQIYHIISPRHSAVLPGKAPGQFFFGDGNNSISTFSAASGEGRLYCDYIRGTLKIYPTPLITENGVYFLNSDGIFRMLEDGNLTKVIGSQKIDYDVWPTIGYISGWDLDSQGNAIILDFTDRAVCCIRLPRQVVNVLSINGKGTGTPIIRPGSKVLVPLRTLVTTLIPGGYLEDARTVPTPTATTACFIMPPMKAMSFTLKSRISSGRSAAFCLTGSSGFMTTAAAIWRSRSLPFSAD